MENTDTRGIVLLVSWANFHQWHIVPMDIAIAHGTLAAAVTPMQDHLMPHQISLLQIVFATQSISLGLYS